MAPTDSTELLHQLIPRAQDPNNPPLLSVFALIIERAHAIASGASKRDVSLSSPFFPLNDLSKRQSSQQGILVIPTTYYQLNNSTKPGAVVGITLGAILGFLVIFFLVLTIVRQFYGKNEVVEEEIIRTHRGSRSKRSVTASSMSEVEAPPPIRETRRESRRTSRVSRRESRRAPETVVVEEDESEPPAEVVVEEEEDDIVEVIEEHSPEPPARRKKKSGHYRTVDPGAFGGGNAPSRRINRRDS